MQRQPDHIYSEVVKKELISVQDGYLVEQQTRLFGSHAAVTKYLGETKQLEKELQGSNIKFSSPYPQMVAPALAGAFFLSMLVHEREPWKILVLLTAMTAMIYKFVKQPGTHQRARFISAELQEKKQQLQQASSQLAVTHASLENRTLTRTADLTPDVKMSKTVYFTNWLNNASNT